MTSTAAIMTWFITMAIVVSALVGGGVLLASRGKQGHFHLPHRPAHH